MYYAVFLFQQAGLGATSASLLANGLQGVILNIFTLPNMYYMDSWGRRRPMIIGGIGMGIAMMLIGVIMKTKGEPSTYINPIFVLTDWRRPNLRPPYQKDKLQFRRPQRIQRHSRICVHLRNDVCFDVGVCCVGLSSRVV
jgi:hypothetical protein